MPKITTKSPPRRAAASRTASVSGTADTVEARVQEALAWLESRATSATRDGMARFGIPADNALGVMMRDIQALAKQLGRDHALALALWETGVYEARLLTAYVDEPDRVTAAQMDRWCRDFDNWAVVDTLCFALFDRTAHAWAKAARWSRRREEFVKRAGFVLLASLAAHDRDSGDAAFLEALAWVEREACDGRNLVKKSMGWALRRIGSKRSPALRRAARTLAARLATSADAGARWVGKDAQRQFVKEDAKAAATSANKTTDKTTGKGVGKARKPASRGGRTSAR